MSWVSFPFKDDFPWSLIPIVLIIACGVFAYLVFYQIFFGLVAVLLLFSSLVKYFFPTTYSLTEQDIKIKFLGSVKTYSWSRFKKFYVHKDGVHLSPFEKLTGLDPFRGVYLRCKKNIVELESFLMKIMQ